MLMHGLREDGAIVLTYLHPLNAFLRIQPDLGFDK